MSVHILYVSKSMFVSIKTLIYMYKNSVLAQIFHEAIKFYIDPKQMLV